MTHGRGQSHVRYFLPLSSQQHEKESSEKGSTNLSQLLYFKQKDDSLHPLPEGRSRFNPLNWTNLRKWMFFPRTSLEQCYPLLNSFLIPAYYLSSWNRRWRGEKTSKLPRSLERIGEQRRRGRRSLQVESATKNTRGGHRPRRKVEKKSRAEVSLARCFVPFVQNRMKVCRVAGGGGAEGKGGFSRSWRGRVIFMATAPDVQQLRLDAERLAASTGIFIVPWTRCYLLPVHCTYRPSLL